MRLIQKNLAGQLCGIAAAATVTLSLAVVVNPAAAQRQIGFTPGVGPICDGPRGIAPCWVIEQWMAQRSIRFNDSSMGVDLSPFGPFAGAGVAGGLQSFGVPAPAAVWAGRRVQENFGSAGRELTPPDAAIRGFTGVSPRDIREHGILGGPNSEARKIFSIFGG
jgi:hypothetical protein